MPFPKGRTITAEHKAAISAAATRRRQAQATAPAETPAPVVIDRQGTTTPLADLGKTPAPPAGAVSCGLVTPGRISYLRQSIWTLLSDLERMSPEARAGLEPDLGLLDAAAHTAYGLATGHLQVA